ncbi:MAG: cupredoxin domain-containing protein [Halobacteriales archaeon]|nr:cupredoxin domain-containing protein [Halobacteriales archaeon]
MERWTPARGFLVAGLILPALYLTLFTGLAWLGFGPIPFFVIPMAAIGVAGIFWPNRWLLLAGAVLAVIVTAGGSMPGGDPGVLRPDRTLEYSYWWLTALLSPALLVAAIVNVVQARRGAPASATRVGVAAIVLVGALWLGGVATAMQEKAFVPSGGGAAVGLTPDVELTVVAKGDAWEPAALSVPAGKVVKLTVENQDAGAHVFNQDDVGLAADLPAGSTTTVWLRMPAAGTFQFYCELHASKGADGKWSGMVGTLTVT